MSGSGLSVFHRSILDDITADVLGGRSDGHQDAGDDRPVVVVGQDE
jgi:hypothetical protein